MKKATIRKTTKRLAVIAALGLLFLSCEAVPPAEATYLPADCPVAIEAAALALPQGEAPEVIGAPWAAAGDEVASPQGEAQEKPEEQGEEGQAVAAAPVEAAGAPSAGEAEAEEPEEVPAAEEQQEEEPETPRLRGWINLNEATEAQLTLLPGVGPALAGRIAAYRAKRPFRTTRHIMRVRGIGPARYKAIRVHLRLEGETTLRRR